MRKFINISDKILTIPLKKGEIWVNRRGRFFVEDSADFDLMEEMVRKKEIVEIVDIIEKKNNSENEEKVKSFKRKRK
jgi:hypothetical protein